MGREEIFIELGGGAPKTSRLNEKLAEIRLLHFATFQHT